jgi:hypothetical protein
MSGARIRRRLTLIDLITLPDTVLLLLAVLAPFVFRLFRLPQREESQNNLHQIAIAVHDFHDTCGRLPPIVGSATGETPGSIHYHVLPLIEEASVHESLSEKGSGTVVHSTRRVVPATPFG